jgi:hypothetical protein
MTMGDGADMLWFAMAITLVVSALVARQLKLSDWLKMGLAWAAIFALVFIAIRTYQLAAG